MASSISGGGMFRQSKNLKSRGKKGNEYSSSKQPLPVSSDQVFRNAEVEAPTYTGKKGKKKSQASKLPPPVSSEQVFRNTEMETSTYSDIPSASANGAHTKEEDHFGFLYSMSEKDYH
jgi:hypothetical protein